MICRVSLLLLLIHYSSMVYAQNKTADATSEIGFIEFLGDWETNDGKWIDPNELATAEDNELAPAKDIELAPAKDTDARPDPQQEQSDKEDQ